MEQRQQQHRQQIETLDLIFQGLQANLAIVRR